MDQIIVLIFNINPFAKPQKGKGLSLSTKRLWKTLPDKTSEKNEGSQVAGRD